MSSTEILKFIVAMIIMMNPLGSLSIFLQLTYRHPLSEQRNTSITTGIAITVIMLLTIWTGNKFLNLLGITLPSFRFAGGIILLLMGLSMLQSKESPVSYTSEDDEAAKERDSIAIVPIALPVIIGPGAMSTLIITAEDFPNIMSKLLVSFVCIVLAIMMALMLYFAVPIARLVGNSVIKVVTRIMGMIIMAIAVGMLAEGLAGLFPSLIH